MKQGADEKAADQAHHALDFSCSSSASAPPLLRSSTLPFLFAAAALVLGLLLAGCDAAGLEDEPVLVVEGFLEVGKPLPNLQLRQTTSLSAPLGEGGAVSDAEVKLTVGSREVAYRAVPGQPGVYEPVDVEGLEVPEIQPYALDVQWGRRQATASGVLPRPIDILFTATVVSEKPSRAIRLNSLFFDPTLPDSVALDSLGSGTVTYAYSVEVTLAWRVPFEEVGIDSAYWVRAQLKPPEGVTSDEINFFLRPEQVVRERTIPSNNSSIRNWTGVYAVPVPTETSPFPAHQLRIALLRGGLDYARFASSRDTPQRREPVSNVTGGIGIFTGISLDTFAIQVQ